MKTKEKVLKMLADSPEGVNGRQLAEELGISRSAVWKAVQTLKDEGCQIEGVTNRGYRLIKRADKMDGEIIAAESGAAVRLFDSVSSTNILAKEQTANGAPHGTVIIAESQTAGRGRRGRSFVSGGSGIYLSVILRPQIDSTLVPLITPAAAVAVRKAVADCCGKECGIKWVNDIYLNDKKVCGILTEAVTDVESGAIDSVVVGIGINFRGKSADFPEELRDKAGFLLGENETEFSRSDLAARVIRNVLEETADLESRRFLESYRRHSTVIGRRIEYLRGGRRYVATALEIDNNGALEVLRDDGARETLAAGEVSVAGV